MHSLKFSDSDYIVDAPSKTPGKTPDTTSTSSFIVKAVFLMYIRWMNSS